MCPRAYLFPVTILKLHLINSDAPLYPKSAHTARVTTLFAHTLPKGDDLTVRFDDGTGRTMKMKPGRTSFIECTNLFCSLTPEQQALAENSLV